MVAQRDSSSQPATRAQFDWPLIDEELFSMIFPLREALNSDAISTDEAASALSSTIRSLFEQAARIAVSCSYRIFNSRASPGWDLLDHLR